MAWVRSNAGLLLRSLGGRGFNNLKAVYQEMLAALQPLTPFPLLNTFQHSTNSARWRRGEHERDVSGLRNWPRRTISFESMYSSQVN